MSALPLLFGALPFHEAGNPLAPEDPKKCDCCLGTPSPYPPECCAIARITASNFLFRTWSYAFDDVGICPGPRPDIRCGPVDTDGGVNGTYDVLLNNGTMPDPWSECPVDGALNFARNCKPFPDNFDCDIPWEVDCCIEKWQAYASRIGDPTQASGGIALNTGQFWAAKAGGPTILYDLALTRNRGSVDPSCNQFFIESFEPAQGQDFQPGNFGTKTILLTNATLEVNFVPS